MLILNAFYNHLYQMQHLILDHAHPIHLQLNEYLILGKARKVYKALKKINLEDVDAINTSLFAFLNYTSLTAINKVDEALKWKDQVNQTDLNKVKHIVKN